MCVSSVIEIKSLHFFFFFRLFYFSDNVYNGTYCGNYLFVMSERAPIVSDTTTSTEVVFLGSQWDNSFKYEVQNKV